MDWALWAGLVVVSAIAGVAVLWVVGGYYEIRYYRNRRHEPETWKCQPKRFLSAEKRREAMLLSSANLIMAGTISGTLIYFLVRGWQTPIYYEVSDYGWLWTLASTVLLFVLMDALAYYTHRFLHLKPIYRKIHRWHHRYPAPSPWVVTALHPVEMLMLQVVTFIPLMIIPFHYVSIIGVLIYILVFNIIDHSGVRLKSRWPWQGPSMYHDDHHVYFHVNFGQHLMLWDRLHGTLRRLNRRYGNDVFGGKGAALDETSSPVPFVRY